MRIDRRRLLATAAMLAATALLPGSPSAQPSSFATFIQQLGDDAIALLDHDPTLTLPEHARLRDLVDQRRRVQLAQGGCHGAVG